MPHRHDGVAWHGLFQRPSVIPLRLYLIAALAAALLAGLGYVAMLKRDNTALKAQAAAATQQAANNAEAVRQVDHYEHTQTIIRERASDAVQAVQAAPDASAPLPEGLRAAWASGIASVRGNGSSGLPDAPADVPR